MKFKNLTLLFVLPTILSGCVVGAVADLAVTTVVTAGKLAVKGTGALISAAIPDGDDDKKDKKKAHKEPHGGQTIQSPLPPDTSPQNHAYGYPAVPSANPQPYPHRPAVTTRYITIDADGQAHETAAPYQTE